MLRGEKGMVIKPDMANAFHRVRYSFLFDVHHKFGFNIEFVACISACINSPSILPLVNGNLVGFL